MDINCGFNSLLGILKIEGLNVINFLVGIFWWLVEINLLCIWYICIKLVGNLVIDNL